ncbi:MAG: hypothetical protein ACRC46_11205 [Thermoguttaceae bacterium]
MKKTLKQGKNGVMFGKNVIQIKKRFLFFMTCVFVFVATFLIVPLMLGIFRPSALYYVLLKKPALVFPDQISKDYYEALDRGKVTRDPNEKYDKLIQGTWAIESPYTSLLEFRNWDGWQDTRLYLYPDGRFKLINANIQIDDLWENYKKNDNVRIAPDYTGTWHLSGISAFGVIFHDKNAKPSKLRYMMLWDTDVNSSEGYRLCQTIEMSTDRAGMVWKKMSDQTDEFCTTAGAE